jgi:hypothetical protein
MSLAGKHTAKEQVRQALKEGLAEDRLLCGSENRTSKAWFITSHLTRATGQPQILAHLFPLGAHGSGNPRAAHAGAAV